MSSATDSRRDLWKAVIQQALLDATSASQSTKARLERPRARAWFEEPNADFDEVCELAGFEPYQVRRFALERIAAADSGLPSAPKKTEASVATHEHDGERLTLAQWAQRIGVPKNSLQVRLVRGWTLSRALTTPFAAPKTGTARRNIEVSHH